MSQSESVTCRVCEAVNGKDNRFCVSCGIELSDRCPKCDAHILKSDKFCIGCGLKLFEEVPPSKPTPTPKFEVQRPKRKRLLFATLGGLGLVMIIIAIVETVTGSETEPQTTVEVPRRSRQQRKKFSRLQAI